MTRKTNEMMNVIAEVRASFGSFDLGLLGEWIDANYVSKKEHQEVYARNQELIALNKKLMGEIRDVVNRKTKG